MPTYRGTTAKGVYHLILDEGAMDYDAEDMKQGINVPKLTLLQQLWVKYFDIDPRGGFFHPGPHA